LSSFDGSGIIAALKIFVLAIFFGLIFGGLAVLLIRFLTHKYRVIILEKKAGGIITPCVDRARVGKKDGVKKTSFLNTKGNMVELPYDYLFPTVKRNIFDVFAPKETFFVFSYQEGEFIPVNIQEDFGKFQFEPIDTGAEIWRDMEKKLIRDKHNKDPFWKTAQFSILVITTAWLLGLTLMIVFFKT
jgi:hypothetical protein